MPGSMRDVYRIVSILVAALLVSTNANATLGTCADPYDFVFFRFELMKASRNAHGDFIGTFEIENTRFEKEIILEGTANRGVLKMDYPELHLEFMDLNGSWRPFMYLPGSFLLPPNKLRVPPGSKVSFVTQLPTKEQLELGGYRFRVLLSGGPGVCIQSEPFVVVQKRDPIERFSPEKRSNKTVDRKRE